MLFAYQGLVFCFAIQLGFLYCCSCLLFFFLYNYFAYFIFFFSSIWIQLACKIVMFLWSFPTFFEELNRWVEFSLFCFFCFFFFHALQSIWLIYVCIDLHFSLHQRLHCLSLAEFDYFMIVNFKANRVIYIWFVLSSTYSYQCLWVLVFRCNFWDSK